jgi:rubrerythrin
MVGSGVASKDGELLLRALREGIDMEKKGEAFYTTAAEKVKNPHGRLTLGFLAREEKRHRDYLLEVLKNLESCEPLKKSPFPRRSRLQKEEILDKMRRMGVRLRVSGGNKEVVREAMGVERRSIDFYQGLLERTGDPGVRRVFQDLAREEKNHFEWLEFILDALELHGYWYDLESHFALEG